MKIPRIKLFPKMQHGIKIAEKHQEEIRISPKSGKNQARPELIEIKFSLADRITWKTGVITLTAISFLVCIMLLAIPKYRGTSYAETLPTIQLPAQENTTSTSTYWVERWVLEDDFINLITSDRTPLLITWETLARVEQILSWSIGLRSLKKGDAIYWVTQVVSDDSVSIARTDKILGLVIKSASKDTALCAIYYQPEKGDATFYDRDARPCQRRFLQSPVKYGDISSRYNLIRLHPVLKSIKPHRGTDFAAPEGAEVYALAEGMITERTFKSGNGNYIKIQHDSIYATAYLHLSRFHPALAVGDRVRQGQLIGYVGSTGLSTGPHVCLRFWRRNHQDDFIQAYPYLPKPPALPFQEQQKFHLLRDSLLSAVESFDI